ncbi:MAG: enoyl-ACP reductase [Deltaproteobacteria bacterium]|nr:enoyl-ACP reductase [Deltaproteobacteria bacterium]
MNLKGKRALIMGLANERSIAFGIAKAFKEAGAELGFTYIDAIEKRMRPIAEELGATLITPCDVSKDEDISKLASTIQDKWQNKFDILVHSLAYAEREDLEKEFVFTSRKGFATALDISAYSLVAVTAALLPALEASKGSVITLSYYGAERVVPNYNVMGVAKAALEASTRYLAADCGARGVRVNAISAGPIRTLAASGVKDFRSILTKIETAAPLRRNITIEDVGQTALFLASDSSRGITGEIMHVDSGYNIMGL